MPGVATTGSSNISFLDSKIIADLCAGKFYIDLSPSIYIGGGASSVLGANVKITKTESGVVLKPYGSNYEISPASSGGMNAVIEYAIPTIAGNYQYGSYTIDVQLFDGVNSWTVTKTVNICEPDQKYKTRKYGSLSARLDGVCKDGKVYVQVDTVPNYKGHVVESQVNDFSLEYPTSSGLPVLETSLSSFSVALFEGVYKITGTICATYNYGDNVYVKVNYKVKREKDIKCIIDECCVLEQLVALHKKLGTDCSDEEIIETNSKIFDTLRLLKTAQLAAECGEDPSEYITALETLLGCRCTCNCNEGTPIINNAPAKDFLIEGCNVVKTPAGLTDHYQIDNYEYKVDVNVNGILTVSVPTLADCIQTTQLNFSVAAMYDSVKAQANNDTEGVFWASVINRSLSSIDPICLGVPALTWQGYTFSQKVAALVAAMCGCCSCSAVVSSADTAQSGGDVTITWVDTGEYSVDIYLDGVFMGNVLSAIDSFTFVGAADGQQHEYMLMPRCSNGRSGVPIIGTFEFLGCPAISPPVVSTNNANGVECPYDLTALVSTPPAGITTEWHTANNTDAGTLVADPTAVSSGVYYAFAKDSNGCYSTSTQVTVVCEAEVSCTAPQNLLVEESQFSGNVVSFQSAAFPPPANSYTVKRRNFVDPDVPASYTTIGTPTWNAGLNRWVITDLTSSDNFLYVYTAQSNCGNSPQTTPRVTYTFAVINCSAMTFVPADTTLSYSFDHVGGQVDKYEIRLYNSTGVTLLETDTFTPAFANPIAGSFTGLTAGTYYKVAMRAYIGTTFQDCPIVDVATTGGTYYFYDATEFSCADNCATPVDNLVVASTNPALTLNKYYRHSAFGGGNDRIFYLNAVTTDSPGTEPIISGTSYNNCTLACTDS